MQTRAERYRRNAEQEKAAYRAWYRDNAERRRLTEQRRYWTQRYYEAQQSLDASVTRIGDARLNMDAIDRQLGDLEV